MKISVWCKKHEVPAKGKPFFIPSEGHSWELDLSDVYCDLHLLVAHEDAAEAFEVRKEEE